MGTGTRRGTERVRVRDLQISIRILHTMESTHDKNSGIWTRARRVLDTDADDGLVANIHVAFYVRRYLVGEPL